ncbi:glycosyltransferase [Natrinema sp. H-ect4]|uniref:glycosyltransferase n=1 Tax=Natrinema sp. H-ect4 TaxID=3242699 RepID=UPI0035A9767D
MTSSKSILYIGTLITDEIATDYDISYSLAGNNKRTNVVKALGTNHDVDVLSPMFLSNGSYSLHGARAYQHPETNVTIRTSPTVDIPLLNFIVLGISTTIWALLMAYRSDYDVVVFYNFSWKAVLPAYVLRLTQGIPLVIEYEDGLVHHDHIVMRLVARLTSRFDGLVDGGICANEMLASRLETDNTTVVYGPPSIGMPAELPSPSYEQSEHVIMYAGALDRVRGASEFVRLADSIAAERDDVVFWMSGYGSESEHAHIESEIVDCTHAEIEFFGTLPWDDYRDRLVSADILVNPQDPAEDITRYTFPSKLLDFMATGNYVVTTDIEGIDAHFHDKLIMGGSSVKSLTNTIGKVLDDSPLVERRANACREWIESECSVRGISGRIEGVLMSI